MAKPKHRKAASTIPSAVPSRPSSRSPSPAPRPFQPFRFFGLPPELRLRIYDEVLGTPDVIDLNPLNHQLITPRLALFLVSHRMHEEAYRVFYSQTIRLFPDHGRFFYTKKPVLLQRLPVRYREAITNMELRLGKGWHKVPRCQNVHPDIGLTDCINLKTLKIFVELDPSDSVFAGFHGAGGTEYTYKWFCVDMLTSIFEQVSSLETVEIDGYPSVQRDAPLISELCKTVAEYNKSLVWGPLRGWNKEPIEKRGLVKLEMAMASMSITSSTTQIVALETRQEVH